VEVAIDDEGLIKIPRVDIAFDCGPQVNPERVRSQLEGAVVMGLSLATYGEITFETNPVFRRSRPRCAMPFERRRASVSGVCRS
jgi:isoquinoline 1-oxidoreductase beta subunit